METIHIVFAGSAPDLRFVEVETPEGNGISVGEWREIAGSQTLILDIDDSKATPTVSDGGCDRRLGAACRRYASECHRERIAGVYTFASMLDGYDPEWWWELMRSRHCDTMSGKPL